MLASALFIMFLFIVFAVVSFTKSEEIVNSSEVLVKSKIPGLIAAGNLKRDFQAQTISLYQLYADAGFDAYKDRYTTIKSAILIDTANLEVLQEYKIVADIVKKQLDDRDKIADEFVKTMTQQEIDWDLARDYLQKYSAVALKLEQDMDNVISEVSRQTELEATNSKDELSILLKIGIVFSFLLLFALLYLIHQIQMQMRAPSVSRY